MSMNKSVKPIKLSINSYTDVYRRIAMSEAYRAVWSGEKTASMTFEAYADTVARVIFDDIERGQWGGTYYMDGRAVRGQYDDTLYSVGGAYPTGITLEKDEVTNYVDVLAAIELLREVIVDLQSDSDELIAIGFWIDSEDNDLVWFDASNVVAGLDNAMELARKRGEKAIYHFYTDSEIRVDYPVSAGKGYGKGWENYNRGRHQ